MSVGQHIGQQMGGLVTKLPNQRGANTSQSRQLYVAINNESVGPIDSDVLRLLITSGTVTQDSMVWRNGDVDWHAARDIPEILEMFISQENQRQVIPPPLPPK